MHDLPLLTTLAAGFTAALICGLITQRLGLSPIVGYLLGGLLIGPHTPGFRGDVNLATQMAEIGVMLLMFGVGLHFHLKELLQVKNIAIPGALVQSTAATIFGLAVALAFGWDVKAGLVIGMALAVASTVVLMRVLMDNNQLDTVHGHVAVGWLIVEDILTVVLLVLIPAMAITGASESGDAHGEAGGNIFLALGWAFLKLAILVALLLTVGARVIPWILVQVARLRSRELFTLTVLVFAVGVATFAYTVFGVSVALGAFLAGMVVGQSPVSQQAAADALPLRDAFAVIFFVSVGMLFDPWFLIQQPLLVLAALGIVLLVKPLAAMLIVGVMGYSLKTALTVAIGLAQIGEFSFILANLGRDHNLLPEEGMSMLVACAIISITINPLLFRKIDSIERLLLNNPMWKFINRRAATMHQMSNDTVATLVSEKEVPLALIIGYGPVGRTTDRLLRAAGMETVVIDLNMDTVKGLREINRLSIFGDATNKEVLRQAGVAKASYLVVTLPHSQNRDPLINAAKDLNPKLVILVRARYLSELAPLRRAGATDACVEETEAAIALARLALRHLGADEEKVQREATRIRAELEGTALA